MGTTPLEANLLQQLTVTREEVLYDIFLDPHKVYHDMDRDIFLETLECYGVVIRALHLLRQYWDRLSMVAWAGGYYIATFKDYRILT